MDEQMVERVQATVRVLDAIDEYARAWDMTVEEALETLVRAQGVAREARKTYDSE